MYNLTSPLDAWVLITFWLNSSNEIAMWELKFKLFFYTLSHIVNQNDWQIYREEQTQCSCQSYGQVALKSQVFTPQSVTTQPFHTWSWPSHKPSAHCANPYFSLAGTQTTTSNWKHWLTPVSEEPKPQNLYNASQTPISSSLADTLWQSESALVGYAAMIIVLLM